MKNPLKKIVLVFILVAMLPISFIVYELSSLSKNEEIVKEIYKNQLDAILFSVNQYSDDIMNSWANRISLAATAERKEIRQDTTTNLHSVLRQSDAVKYFYVSDLRGKSSIYSLYENTELENTRLVIDRIVAKNQERVSRLIRYQETGFRKMEAADTILQGNTIPVFFVFDEGQGNVRLGVLIIHLPDFIKNTLGPKMQAISQEKFIISATQEGSDFPVYSTEPKEQNRGDQKIKTALQTKAFWLLPGYYLGISLKGATLEDLVKERMNTSVGILSLLMMILIAGILFLYRNIRREIYLSQAKSEFVSNVSHEIRTPLSLISMYAETLEMDRVNEDKKKEYYSIIAKETARLTKIVNRILNFSQIEANKKQYNFGAIQVGDLCDEIMESYFFPLQDKGFTCEVSKEDVPVIHGDRESILEAIMNLLDNAIKYSRETKRIHIRIFKEQKYVCVEVKDEGMGIARNHQHEIFDQFYRVPSGDVHNTKGSGLGLALVKKTMETHHGKVKVESAIDKGSTFRLYFPTKNEAPS